MRLEKLNSRFEDSVIQFEAQVMHLDSRSLYSQVGEPEERSRDIAGADKLHFLKGATSITPIQGNSRIDADISNHNFQNYEPSAASRTHFAELVRFWFPFAQGLKNKSIGSVALSCQELTFR